MSGIISISISAISDSDGLNITKEVSPSDVKPPGKTHRLFKLGDPISVLRPLGDSSSPRTTKRSATIRPVLEVIRALIVSESVTTDVRSIGRSELGGTTKPL